MPLSKKTGNKEIINTTVICPRCKSTLDARISRGKLVKTFLFWLPIKRFVCYKCNRKVYKWGA